jgi:hypothetical protein
MVDEVIGKTVEQAQQKVKEAWERKPAEDRAQEATKKKRARDRAPQVLVDLCKKIAQEANQRRSELRITIKKEGFHIRKAEAEDVNLLAHEIAIKQLEKAPYNFRVEGSLGIHDEVPYVESGWYGGLWTIRW